MDTNTLMNSIPLWDVVVRLLLAVVVGGIIGLERAGTNHDAGLRTHVLVCLGAAVVMITSVELRSIVYYDVGRIGAQVVSGIGFLGAGCILVNGTKIKGLTTAAGLWATACIGLAIGCGFYYISIISAIIALLSVLALKPISSKLQSHNKVNLDIYISCNDDTIAKAVKAVSTRDVNILDTQKEGDGYLLRLRAPADSENDLTVCLFKVKGVNGVTIK